MEIEENVIVGFTSLNIQTGYQLMSDTVDRKSIDVLQIISSKFTWLDTLMLYFPTYCATIPTGEKRNKYLTILIIIFATIFSILDNGIWAYFDWDTDKSTIIFTLMNSTAIIGWISD